MSRIMSLDKQIEQRAKKWFLNNQLPDSRGKISKTFFIENKEKIIKKYLDEHPKIAKEYHEKKQKLLQAKILAVTGVVTLTTLGGIHYLSNNKQVKQNTIQIEQEELIDDMEQEEVVELEEDSYDRFFDEAKDMKNTEERDKFITNQTKQVIVEKYNKEHPEKTITIDELETYVLNEWVLQKTDKLGNHTYERLPKGSQYIKTETEESIQKQIYDFRVNEKTVAVFLDSGDVLPDKSVEKQDMFFQKMISLVKESEELKDIYKYDNSDSYIEKQQEKYKAEIEKLIENAKNTDIAKEEIEK